MALLTTSSPTISLNSRQISLSLSELGLYDWPRLPFKYGQDFRWCGLEPFNTWNAMYEED